MAFSRFQSCGFCIAANCPGMSRTVPDVEVLSCVLHRTCFLAKMSRKLYSTELINNYNLPIILVNSLATFKTTTVRS